MQYFPVWPILDIGRIRKTAQASGYSQANITLNQIATQSMPLDLY